MLRQLQFVRWVVVGVLLLAGAGAMHRAFAQGGTATILGTVTDSSGAAIPGAKVDAKAVDTGQTTSVVADGQGRFNIPLLPIGQYQVQASSNGFQTAIHSGITLTVGAQITVSFAMQPGQVQQTVTVQSGQGAQVESTTSSIDTLVAPVQMRELPLNGRDFEQLITLGPGVVKMPSIGASTYGTGANYSIAGSRPEGQAFLLDNTNVQNFWNHGTGSGALGTTLGVDSIAEFQMLTNTYSAQYGGAGAVMNAATRSGTNSFHGSGYEFFRDSALDARNFFDGPTIPSFQQNQFGGTLGGPIIKNKFFFFTNFESVHLALGQTFIAFVPDLASRSGPVVPSVVNTLALYPLPDPTLPDSNGIGQVRQAATKSGVENYAVARLDYTISQNDSAFLRYGVDQANVSTPNSAAVPIPLWGETDTTFNHYVTIQEKHIFSSNTINLLQFSYVRNDETQATTHNTPALQFFPNAPQNGSVNVTGLSTLGAGGLNPSYEIQNRFGYEDDVFLTHKAHNFTFGVAIERIQDNTSSPLVIGGSWTFGSIQQFLQTGKANLLVAPLPNLNNAIADFRELHLAPYFEDSWKVSPKLTLNMGLRYEPTSNITESGPIHMVALPQTPLTTRGVINSAGPFAFTPVRYAFANNPSLRNIDPRIGFAYDPAADNKTVIRGGFGIFHDLIDAYNVGPQYWLSSTTYTQGSSANVPYGVNPPVGNSPITQTQGIAFQTDATPYVMQYNLNIQREMGWNTVAQIGYVGSLGRNLFMMGDLNPPVNTGTIQNPILGTAGANPCPAVPTPGCSNFAVPHARLQPAGQAIPGNRLSNLGYLLNEYTGGISNYNSLQASVTHELSHNFQMQVSYTYSKSLDTGSSEVNGLEGPGSNAINQNPYLPNGTQDYGLSIFNLKHSFEISGLYQLPFSKNNFVRGWELTGIFSATSGPPFTLYDGFDRAGLNELGAGERPNVAPGCSNNPKLGIITATRNEWYNTSCFTLQPVGTFGNLGRDTVIGPGFADLDAALLKTTNFPKISDAFSVQLRAETFDTLNHPNFYFPSGGGQSVFTSSGGINPAAARITQTNGNQVIGGAQRVIQLGVKILF